MNESAVVLVVDDDDGVRLAVRRMLEREGHVVLDAASGAEAVEAARANRCDVVVLDVGLPDRSGYQVMADLRAQRADVPILLLTGQDAPSARAFGLDAGADDYLIKPASMIELAARVRVLLRRRQSPDEQLRAGDIQVDVRARTVTLRGTVVELTRLEHDLLVYFLQHPGEVLNRDELLERVWGSSPAYQSGAVITEYLSRLRRKLGELPIVAVRGVGYRYDRV
jgi:DNA-binding response OmpR family regulator